MLISLLLLFNWGSPRDIINCARRISAKGPLVHWRRQGTTFEDIITVLTLGNRQSQLSVQLTAAPGIYRNPLGLILCNQLFSIAAMLKTWKEYSQIGFWTTGNHLLQYMCITCLIAYMLLLFTINIFPFTPAHLLVLTIALCVWTARFNPHAHLLFLVSLSDLPHTPLVPCNCQKSNNV